MSTPRCGVREDERSPRSWSRRLAPPPPSAGARLSPATTKADRWGIASSTHCWSARALGLTRVLSLSFEVEFFSGHGFVPIAGTPVGTDVYLQMLRSHDDGVAEFLDLARVKPNTLGNTRMMLEL